MLYFDTEKYDFQKIYNSIATFYPIGVPRENNPLYSSYQGQKELGDLLTENIHNEKHFENRWVKIQSEIESTLQRRIIGTTYGQSPSFSAYIEIDTLTLDDLTRYKELYFFVSLLGPYYTVIGQDRNQIQFNKSCFRNTSFLIISPENEYEELFKNLCSEIENKFMGYRFVPYYIYNQEIEGLYTRYREDNKSKVFEAIFNNQIDLNAPTLGNTQFKAEVWVNAGFVSKENSGWTIYPPDSFTQ